MRVGIITHNYPATSKERKDAGIFLYDFAQELAKQHNVFVLAPDFRGEKESYKRVPVTWFKWRGGDRKLGDFSLTDPRSFFDFLGLLFSGMRAATSFTRENRIDILIGAWAFPSGFFAWWVNKRLDIPYVTWSLGSDINKYFKMPVLRQLTILSLRSAKFCFANSYQLCREISNAIQKKCIFLPAITDLQFSTTKRKTKSKLTRFLFVGRLEKVKGVDILIDAFCGLGKNKNWELFIGGDGLLETLLKGKISNTGLDKRIVFLGRLDALGVATQMRKSDFLVIPSRSESLPLVIIEAARARLPLIASDVGDCRRMVRGYGAGYVFTNGDISQLRNVIRKAMKTNRKQFALGLKKISEDFKQEKAVAIFEKYAK